MSKNRLIVLCEICKQELCLLIADRFAAPLNGGMFESKDRQRYPLPWDVRCEWRYIKCPMCHNRPFIQDDQVLTNRGLIKVGMDVERAALDQAECAYNDYMPEPPKRRWKVGEQFRHGKRLYIVTGVAGVAGDTINAQAVRRAKNESKKKKISFKA